MIVVLTVLAMASIAAFMVVGVQGGWAFAVAFRGRKVLAMMLVALAIGVSTVLFQTITENHILTPSIMGFDALYVLIQTVVVFALGASALATLDARLSWLIEVAVMVGVSALLFRWVLIGRRRGIHVLVLAGIVIGVLLRSITALLQRMLDPAAFAVLQDSFFASFNAVDPQLLLVSAALTVLALACGLRLLPVLDVLVLGEPGAVGLGVDHRRVVSQVLVLVAVLVAVSTALVGPITFFGLIVVSVARSLLPTFRHGWLLAASVLLGIICLVGGQLVLEHMLGLATALSVVIEFAGGIAFIVILVRRGVR